MIFIGEFLFKVFYRFVLAPIGLCGILIASIFNAKIASILSLRMRRRFHGSLDPKRKTFWFHCASGEFEYAKPLIRQIKAQQAESQIAVTYFSSSFVGPIERHSQVDYSCPLPFEFPGAMNSMIRNLRPEALFIARTDLWPELLWACRRLSIPTHLFARTQRPRSLFSRLWFRFLSRNLTSIHCVDEEDLKNLKASGSQTPLFQSGDPRYEQVIQRLETSTPPLLKNQFLSDKKQFIAGSTWPEDENILFDALLPFFEKSSLQLILAPHEPSPRHLAELKEKLTLLKLSFQTLSEFEQSRRDKKIVGPGEQPLLFDREVLLIDRVGLLAELYTLADLAFVGGSFRGSVHSVMEPLAAGCPTIIGPDSKNNREAQIFSQVQLGIKSLNAVTSVKNSEEFKSLPHWNFSKKELNQSGTKIQGEIKKHQGASQTILAQALSQP